MSQGNWEYLEEPLGRPEDEGALDRLGELLAQGWEFLGVRFSQGLGLYRRRVLQSAASSAPETVQSKKGADKDDARVPSARTRH